MRFPVDPVMRRGLDIDVLECPDCGERLRFVATVMLSSAIRRILRHLGLPSDPVELAPHELGTVPPDILSETGADLFVKTNEDGLTFQAPWTGSVEGPLANGRRCYTLDNLDTLDPLDPIPSELTVGVFTDGPVRDFVLTVPVQTLC